MIKAILLTVCILGLLAAIGLGGFFIYKQISLRNKEDSMTLDEAKAKLIALYKRRVDEFKDGNNGWHRPSKEEVVEYAKQLDTELNQKLKELEESYVNKPKPKSYKTHMGIFVGLAIAMLGITITIPSSFHQVEAGTYAVVKEVGQITEVRTPGTYFDFYMTRSYQTYDATVQQVKINTAAYSNDGQTMDLEVYLQYQIQLDNLIIKFNSAWKTEYDNCVTKMLDLSVKIKMLDDKEKTSGLTPEEEALKLQYETEYEELEASEPSLKEKYNLYLKYVNTYSNGQIIQTEGIAGKYVTLQSLQDRIETQCIEKTKAVLSSAPAMDIIQHRPQYSNTVSQTVRDAIGPDYYVNVQDVVLTDISFTDEFEKSVEDKVIAEQQKEAAETKAKADAEVARIKAENEKEVAEIEAEKKRIEAEADAEVVRIAAEAEAKATVAKIVEIARTVGFTVIETATGYEIKFDEIHTEAMFKEVVQQYLEYLAYLDKWNGELPDVVSGDGAISIIIPGTSTDASSGDGE